MRESPVPFAPPWIEEEDVQEVVAALRSGWITTGPRTRRFEEAFAVAVDAPAALALNSGTAALHTALAALAIGPGDSVLTTPLTFCSGVHVIEQVGAQPLFVDVDAETLNIDPNQFLRVIEESDRNVRCLMPVHLYGQPCRMDVLLDVAESHGLPIVEDAAHALPAAYRGQTIGSLARHSKQPVMTCFSFYATKNLTTAEGGMLTGPQDIIDRARIWSLHGMTGDAWKRYGNDADWAYDVILPGFKYNMTDLQAALGLAQLARLSNVHERRASIAARYSAAFAELEELQTPQPLPDTSHAWHIYALRLHLDRLRISRDEFIRELRVRQVSASVHFIPVHMLSYYRERYGYRAEDFPVAFREFRRLVSLPLYPQMKSVDVDDVIEAVVDVVRCHRA